MVGKNRVPELLFLLTHLRSRMGVLLCVGAGITRQHGTARSTGSNNCGGKCLFGGILQLLEETHVRKVGICMLDFGMSSCHILLE